MVNKFPKSKELTVAVQKFFLSQVFPGSFCKIYGRDLFWRGQITPSPLSATYEVVVKYQEKGSPRVFVENPKLVAPEGKKLPHIYQEGNLCLYYSRDEWNGNKLIAETILPWALEWLIHYEIWRATGEWHGGGISLVGQKSMDDLP